MDVTAFFAECEAAYHLAREESRVNQEQRLRELFQTILALPKVPEILLDTRPPATRLGDLRITLFAGEGPDALLVTTSCRGAGCGAKFVRIVRSRVDLGCLLCERAACSHNGEGEGA